MNGTKQPDREKEPKYSPTYEEFSDTKAMIAEIKANLSHKADKSWVIGGALTALLALLLAFLTMSVSVITRLVAIIIDKQ